jgi:hypothetical protein
VVTVESSSLPILRVASQPGGRIGDKGFTAGARHDCGCIAAASIGVPVLYIVNNRQNTVDKAKTRALD